jgi:hypothetical protein
MMNMIDKWRTSGMRQKDFYLKYNIPPNTFYYWLKRYRLQHNQQPLAAASFVQLQPCEPVTTNNIELLLPNGIRILFHEPVSASYLKSLLP